MKSLFVICVSILCVEPFFANCFAFDYVEKIAQETREIICVVDQRGNPVAEANVWGGFQTGNGMHDYVAINEYTDSNGECTISGLHNGRLSLRITKDGYYPSELILSCCSAESVAMNAESGGQPCGEKRTIVLKKIVSPGNLVVFPRSLRDIRIPELDVWLGFDLELHDWTSPNGKGIHDDILFLLHEGCADASMEFLYELKVSFTNNPYAGAYVVTKDKDSKFDTSYMVEAERMFEKDFVFVIAYQKGLGKVLDVLDDSHYMVFRTRTEIDEEGRLKSAHYGEILGPLLFDREELMLSDGCYNPKVNDLWLEDGRNLRKILGDRWSNSPFKVEP